MSSGTTPALVPDCLDFQSVAGVIDVVAGYDPVNLATLFTMIWKRAETRAVLRAAVACRDPLSDLGTICKDAIKTLLARPRESS